jgi:hypothetical protein
VPVGRLTIFVGRTIEPIVTVLTAWFRSLPRPLDSPGILRLMEETFFLSLLSRLAITLSTKVKTVDRGICLHPIVQVSLPRTQCFSRYLYTTVR